MKAIWILKIERSSSYWDKRSHPFVIRCIGSVYIYLYIYLFGYSFATFVVHEVSSHKMCSNVQSHINLEVL